MIVELIIVGILILIFITSILYSYTGIGKQFYHNILHWHKPNDIKNFDGCSFNSKCKYCGKEIMQDSQGNWF